VTISVVSTWTGGQSNTSGTPVNPPPTTLSLQVSVANVTGDWMIAVVAVDGIVNPTTASAVVSDNVHNWWEPVFSPESTSSSSGNVKVGVWMAPAATAASYVSIAPTAPVNAIAAVIYDVTGMEAWVNTACVNADANSASALGTMSLGAPPSSASSIVFTGAVVDSTSVTLSLGSGAGWSSAASTTVSGQLSLSAAYQVAAGATSAVWTSSGTTDLAGVLGFAVGAATALTPRNTYWPVTIAEMGFGSGFQTPADQIVWQPVTTAYLQMTITQGRQYEAAQLSAGEGTLYLDNPYKQFIPTQTQQAQVQWYGNGATAAPNTAVTSSLPVTGDVTYTFNAYLWQSAAYASGSYIYIDWQDSSGHISYSTSSSVSATSPVLATLTAAAPSSATFCYLGLGVTGTPPATTIFYAAAAAGSTLQLPQSVTWISVNSSVPTALLPWNAFQTVTTGTPVRLRANWAGGGWQMQWNGNGTAGIPGFLSLRTGTSGIPCTGSTVYTLSAWMASSPAWGAGGVFGVNWYNAAGSYISSTTGTPVADLSLVPQLVAVKVTSPSTAAFATPYVEASGTPPSTTTFYAAAAPYGASASQPYLNMSPATTFIAVNSATVTTLAAWVPNPSGPAQPSPWWIPYSGFIERLPQQWDENLRGFTEATITDYWFACNYEPQPILPQELLNDDPYAYWPLTDPAGTTAATNLAPGNSNTLNVTNSKYGTGGVTESFYENTGALLGAQSTLVVSTTFDVTQEAGMWQLSNASSSGGSPPWEATGISLTCTDTNFPSIANGMTIEIWVQATSPYTSVGQSVWMLSDVDGPLCLLFWANNGVGIFYLQVRGGTETQLQASSTDYTTQGLIHLVLTFNKTTGTFYVNGQVVSSSSPLTFVSPIPASKWTTLTVNGALTTVAGVFGQYQSMNFNGYTGQVVIYPYELTAARVYTHYLAGAFAMAGEPAYYRIERLLTAGNALGRRAILQDPENVVTHVVSTQDVASQAASASVANLTGDLLPGMFYIAPTGDMFYLDRAYAYNQGIVWAIGDDIWNGEYPYDGNIQYDFDPTRIINEIQLTQLDDESITTSSLTAIEAASQAQYGTITDVATGYLQGDANYPLNYGPGLLDLANWLAATYQAPVLRVSQITLSSDDYPASWPLILGISVGDMVTVARRPPGSSSSVLLLTGRVTQTTRTFQYSVTTAVASVSLMIDSSPEEDALTCDDTVRGQLTGTDVLGW
jgi:Concanavalin A-like lectin/glucanases superfamily